MRAEHNIHKRLATILDKLATTNYAPNEVACTTVLFGTLPTIWRLQNDAIKTAFFLRTCAVQNIQKVCGGGGGRRAMQNHYGLAGLYYLM